MVRKRFSCVIAGFVVFLLTACGGNTVTKESVGKPSNYPKKPIVFAAPSGAEGGWDLTARDYESIGGNRLSQTNDDGRK